MTPVIEASGLTKHYGGVTAMDGVDLAIQAGEIVALVGENGAGKTTVINTLAGFLRPDAGEIRVEGTSIAMRSPRDAMRHGIEVVWQQLALASELDASSNLFLGRELVRWRFAKAIMPRDSKKMARMTSESLAQLNISLPSVTRVPVQKLSGGQAQALAIARAVTWGSKVLLMDEPTAALGVAQARAVLDVVRRATEYGVGVLLITHTLSAIEELKARVIVMRHGRKVAEVSHNDYDPEVITQLILGVRDHL